MVLKLPFAVKDEAWFPKPGSTVFTEFEARIDYLLLVGSSTVLDDRALSVRWSWPHEFVEKFLVTTKTENFLQQEWFEVEKPNAKVRRQNTEAVLEIFNEVFDRKGNSRCRYNAHREKNVNGRIAEGLKAKAPIGMAQFRAVFEYKKKEWTGGEHEKHLTMETLCAPSHFMTYLEQARLDYIKNKHAVKAKEEGVTLEGTRYK